MQLEDLAVGGSLLGVVPGETVRVVSLQWYGQEALELTYKTASGRVGQKLLYRSDQAGLEAIASAANWSFAADGRLFRLVSEAQRIQLAYLFDPFLAVHASQVEPLPHQITAVYEDMLPRLPLRFLLADDPGAGKTIMTGLLIKELIARGDLQRCLVVCPGSLAEQWQDELWQRFQLPFTILTNSGLESARSGNWFLENDLVIARLDKLARDQTTQERLQVEEAAWDLVVCDEAHKMSASFFGGEVKYTKRYQLGRLLSRITRHFLLLTATPHNGKEEDFQLFLALLDPDRFEGRPRGQAQKVEVADLMRRMVKEDLCRFDGTPLFPDRIAKTVSYRLSDAERELYEQVTTYVREQFNRADALNEGAKRTVGFALTVLQRRLASSPQAIYRSLQRRRQRLAKSAQSIQDLLEPAGLEAEDLEDLEEAPDFELEQTENQLLDQATASRTWQELTLEIAELSRLEALAAGVRQSHQDRKWTELAGLLNEILVPGASREKLVIFTEFRDTQEYLVERIQAWSGRPEAVAFVHGGLRREDRRRIQEAFLNDPAVQVLVATDAAGEGVNLQRAHLMVNYDLPWNPNRLEQRFGRIHRIGQTQDCHLWNLLAQETREGLVYETLLRKLEEARQALGGRVFDVLGKLQFDSKPLRDLLIEAIRYGQDPDVKARLEQAVAGAVDRDHLRQLLEDRALAQEVMDTSRVQAVRADMERAEARRLQPHYIESFFLEAFNELGGSVHPREPGRYQVTHVPLELRQRHACGQPLVARYERIAFEKANLNLAGKPPAEFVAPGHVLLSTSLEAIWERHHGLLRQGALLVDERDLGSAPRLLFYLDHELQDAAPTPSGQGHTVSRRMLYVEIDQTGEVRGLQYAPYLDYRPLQADEPSPAELLARPELAWLGDQPENLALNYAIQHLVPSHREEIQGYRSEKVRKTRAAVKERLTKEIAYWERRSVELQAKERLGQQNQLNSREAARRAESLRARLQKRMADLDAQESISALPPVVRGGAVIVPRGLIERCQGRPPRVAADTQVAAAWARAAVMAVERSLGFEPVDRELEKLGYDIESRIPGSGKLRFLEVKGRAAGAQTLTVTKNEILFSLNKPADFILAIVEFDGPARRVYYLTQPFGSAPDFGVTSVNYDFAELLARAQPQVL